MIRNITVIYLGSSEAYLRTEMASPDISSYRCNSDGWCESPPVTYARECDVTVCPGHPREARAWLSLHLPSRPGDSHAIDGGESSIPGIGGMPQLGSPQKPVCQPQLTSHLHPHPIFTPQPHSLLDPRKYYTIIP